MRAMPVLFLRGLLPPTTLKGSGCRGPFGAARPLQQRSPHLTCAASRRNVCYATSGGRGSNEGQAIPFGSNAELHAPTEVIPGDLHIPDLGDRRVEDDLPVIGREGETAVGEGENARETACDPA